MMVKSMYYYKPRLREDRAENQSLLSDTNDKLYALNDTRLLDSTHDKRINYWSDKFRTTWKRIIEYKRFGNLASNLLQGQLLY